MGGMAEVHLAYQRGLGGLEKLVVMKRILPHLEGDATFVTMFLEEARLAAQLSHPNVVNVIDVRREDDALYMVMEYLSGVDLRQLIGFARHEDLHIPIPVAVRVIADAAHGLNYAHSARTSQGEPLGVVHRDVTPSNIMLTFDGVTKVLDFGIAKATSSTSSTQVGSVRGQFTYASPEQVEQRPLDRRSDVFSLGVVLYELLTGASPFASDTSAGVLQAVLHRPIFPPGAINPDVPPELDELVLAALRRDVEGRLSTAAELRDGLHEVLGAYGTTMSQARMSRWLRGTLPEVWRAACELEQRVTRQARSGDTPLRSSPSLSVSSSISTPGEAEITRITERPALPPPSTSGPEVVSPMTAPPAEAPGGLWLYAVAAAVATLTVLGVLALAYFLGRSAG